MITNNRDIQVVSASNSSINTLATKNLLQDCLTLSIFQMQHKRHSLALLNLRLALVYTCAAAIGMTTDGSTCSDNINKMVVQARELHPGIAKVLANMEEKGYDLPVEMEKAETDILQVSATSTFNKASLTL